MNKIFVISGPSGVGKKTILDHFINDVDLNLSYSISMTTRPMRKGEIQNKDYYFVSDEEFNIAIENNEMVEWAEFCKNKYGTRKAEINRIIAENKNPILEIETQGAFQVFNNLERSKYVSIFIMPPSIDELLKRLSTRGTETKEVIEKRIQEAKREISYANKYDYVVINDSLENAIKNIIQIIKDNTNEE